MQETIKIMLVMSEAKARRLCQFFAGDHWSVCRYEDLRQATRMLEADRSLRVVVVARTLPSGCWQDALRVVRSSNRACQIILAAERATFGAAVWDGKPCRGSGQKSGLQESVTGLQHCPQSRTRYPPFFLRGEHTRQCDSQPTSEVIVVPSFFELGCSEITGYSMAECSKTTESERLASPARMKQDDEESVIVSLGATV